MSVAEERTTEDSWTVSERRYDLARRGANMRAWHEYHLARAESLRTNRALLIERHEAEKYLPRGSR